MDIPPPKDHLLSFEGASSYELLALLRSRLLIDKTSLDEEVIQQPELFFQAASEAAMAGSLAEEAKEAIKALAADLSLRVRTALEAEGKKSTEALVQSLVEEDRNYKKAKRDFLEYNKQYELLSALKDSYVQRAWMIRHLCELHISGSIATGSVRSKEATEVVDQANMDRRRDIRASSKYKRQ